MQLRKFVKKAHKNAVEHGFWVKERPKSEVLMLLVTEVAEACEADRCGDIDGFNEEIADIFIRCADLCGGYNIDIVPIIKGKMKINKTREYKHNKRY